MDGVDWDRKAVIDEEITCSDSRKRIRPMKMVIMMKGGREDRDVKLVKKTILDSGSANGLARKLKGKFFQWLKKLEDIKVEWSLARSGGNVQKFYGVDDW